MDPFVPWHSWVTQRGPRLSLNPLRMGRKVVTWQAEEALSQAWWMDLNTGWRHPNRQSWQRSEWEENISRGCQFDFLETPLPPDSQTSELSQGSWK